MIIHSGRVKFYLPKKQSMSEEIGMETLQDRVLIHAPHVPMPFVLVTQHPDSLIMELPDGSSVHYHRVAVPKVHWEKNARLARAAAGRETHFTCGQAAEGLIHFEF
jgi:hypothetical protein